MQFTVNSLTRCGGQGHWTVIITVAGEQHRIETTPAEMQFDPGENINETRQRVLERLRSASKEAGAATFAQARTALEGKTYQL